jgi:hypothetical protein
MRLEEGWHGREGEAAGWRWTDGAATLLVPSGGRLGVTVAMIGRYWRERAVEEVTPLGQAVGFSLPYLG